MTLEEMTELLDIMKNHHIECHIDEHDLNYSMLALRVGCFCLRHLEIPIKKASKVGAKEQKMTFNELMCNILNLKKDTNTIYDNAYNDAINACVEELNRYVKDAPKGYFDAEEKAEKINHPQHYNRNGAMECIDEMLIVFSKEAVINFCLCNAYKYRYRAGLKDNAEEDLKKSDWYISKASELKSSKEVDEVTYYCADEQTGSTVPYIRTKCEK